MENKKPCFLDRYFKYTEAGSTLRKEVVAGLTTFFAMAYVLFVVPNILSEAGMEWGAVFLATIISAVAATLIMGLFANVPYSLAPGMGLTAFFVYTVCFGLGFTWQQALSMVLICGLLNIFITVTKIRKYIIKAIPKGLQNAIAGGIGLFVAYIGLLNVGLINFDSGVPGLSAFNNPTIWVFLIGLVIIIVLHVLNVKGAMLITIIATTLIGIPFGVTTTQDTVSFAEACAALPTTFGVIFTAEGIPSLFADATKIPLVLITIFSFSLSDMFDTIGVFIGTGRRTGIFPDLDEQEVKSGGMKTKFDKALFADALGTTVGAIMGTTNITTYVESASGIGVGGRTGLTSVVTSLCFILSAFLAVFVSAVPYAATAPALVMVGIMISAAFKEIEWNDLSEAIPSFFAGLFMALCYSISYGIATSFIMYCLVKVCKKQAKEVHSILWVCTGLFVLNFVLLAIV